MKYLLIACLIVLGLVALTFLPYAKGGYDPLAKTLSMIAWGLGRAGMLLTTIGALWFADSVRRGANSRPASSLIWATFGAGVLISIFITLLAFSAGLIFATAIAVFMGYVNVHILRRLRKIQSSDVAFSPLVPVILIFAPVVVLVLQMELEYPIAEYGRSRVIANSAPLIAEIERYHEKHAKYPLSIFSLYGDYKPSTIGVQRYYYEPTENSYNVIFEEPSLGFGIRRFVVYNPRDQQHLTVHESDRLLLDGPALAADNAGYTIVEPLEHAHWKAFLFRS